MFSFSRCPNKKVNPGNEVVTYYVEYTPRWYVLKELAIGLPNYNRKGWKRKVER